LQKGGAETTCERVKLKYEQGSVEIKWLRRDDVCVCIYTAIGIAGLRSESQVHGSN
jgi:hypothetical protein